LSMRLIDSQGEVSLPSAPASLSCRGLWQKEKQDRRWSPILLLQEWSGQIGVALKDGLRETPGWIALVTRANGEAQPTEPRSWRENEFPE